MLLLGAAVVLGPADLVGRSRGVEVGEEEQAKRIGGGFLERAAARSRTAVDIGEPSGRGEGLVDFSVCSGRYLTRKARAAASLGRWKLSGATNHKPLSQFQHRRRAGEDRTGLSVKLLVRHVISQALAVLRRQSLNVWVRGEIALSENRSTKYSAHL